MLLVYGSMDSLFPRICAVDAVGIGASSKLFLTPCLPRDRHLYYQGDGGGGGGTTRKRPYGGLRLGQQEGLGDLLGNLGSQRRPIPELGWGDIPHIRLQDLRREEEGNVEPSLEEAGSSSSSSLKSPGLTPLLTGLPW